jgi:hypothetical protein
MVVSCDIVSEVVDLLFVQANQLMEGCLVSAAEAVNKKLFILCHLCILPLLDERSSVMVYKNIKKNYGKSWIFVLL